MGRHGLGGRVDPFMAVAGSPHDVFLTAETEIPCFETQALDRWEPAVVVMTDDGDQRWQALQDTYGRCG